MYMYVAIIVNVAIVEDTQDFLFISSSHTTSIIAYIHVYMYLYINLLDRIVLPPIPTIHTVKNCYTPPTIIVLVGEGRAQYFGKGRQYKAMV